MENVEFQPWQMVVTDSVIMMGIYPFLICVNKNQNNAPFKIKSQFGVGRRVIPMDLWRSVASIHSTK